MFEEIEKPVVEIEIFNSKIYRENIKKLFEQEAFNFFILNKGDNIDKETEQELEKAIVLHSCKTFYVSTDFDEKLQEYRNCILYQPIDVSVVLSSQFVIQEKADTFIVYFDISKKYNMEELRIIEKTLMCIDKKTIFLVIINNSSSVRLSNYINLMEKLKNMNCTFALLPLFKEVDLIIEHPCNAYMCNGIKCHSKKSAYPRYLYINREGIYPYRCKNVLLPFLTNISRCEIGSFHEEFKKYESSKAYETFMFCNKEIYMNIVLPHIIKILPWNILIEYILSERMEDSRVC